MDGGLFDNSGASTALEIITCVQREISADSMLKDKVGPILVVGIVSPEEEDPKIPPTNLLVDALASPEALWNARDARASFAVASLRGFASEVNEDTGLKAIIGAPAPAPDPATPPHQNELFFRFGLSDKEGNKKLLIPLGWQLSELAKKEIATQVNRSDAEMKRLKARLLVPPIK